MTQRGPDQEVTCDDVYRVLRDLLDPANTLGEVSSKLTVSEQTVRKRLEELVRDDRIKTKMAGRTRLYWAPGPGMREVVQRLDRIEIRLGDLEENLSELGHE